MSAAPDSLTIILLASVFVVLAEMLRALSAGALLSPPQPRRQLQFDWAVLGAALFFILLNVIPVLLQPFLPVVESAAEKPTPTSRGVEGAILTNLFIMAVLITLIFARPKNRLADYGIDLRGW